MSVLSATGVLNPAQADAYSTALLSLLGDRDPISVLRETPAALYRELEALSPSVLRTPEAPGKWSAATVFAHLADSELVGAFRLRMILAHERPPLAPYDQDLWATRLHYERTDPRENLERFTVLRRANLVLWADASPDELARAGLHGERGEESVDRMRRLYAGHDLAHLRQLARIQTAVIASS
jgi:DinB family protein